MYLDAANNSCALCIGTYLFRMVYEENTRIILIRAEYLYIQFIETPRSRRYSREREQHPSLQSEARVRVFVPDGCYLELERTNSRRFTQYKCTTQVQNLVLLRCPRPRHNNTCLQGGKGLGIATLNTKRALLHSQT